MSTILSKTDFLLYRECPKNAWLKLHKPKVYYSNELSEFEKTIIETGNEVESVARKIFPSGVLIKGRDKEDRVKTLKLVAQKSETIFQAVFVKDQLFAATDILQFDQKSKKWLLIEVKASNSVKDKIHLYDLAFQTILLKKIGLELESVNILHLNPKYIRNGELDIFKLFVADNATDKVNELIPQVEEEIQSALKYLSQETEPSGFCSCIYKGRSAHCTTFSYSNPQVPEYSVHDIARIGVSKAKLTELIDGNIFNIQDIPEYIELSDIQKNQVNAHITKRPLIRRDMINSELENLVYPLYFLDYETFPAAIPRFDGFSPYQQIPFQYSLHIVESAESEPKHLEFLHTGTGDPGPTFAESLKKDIGPIGTVVVWNKKFECKINEELARRIPSMKKFIENVNNRVYDLMDVFSKQYYVHHNFQGSTSIKYILPVLAPELSYKQLEIQEGGTATQRWNELTTGNLSDSEKETIAKNLREYCKLDTFAMFKIWERLFNNSSTY